MKHLDYEVRAASCIYAALPDGRRELLFGEPITTAAAGHTLTVPIDEIEIGELRQAILEVKAISR